MGKRIRVQRRGRGAPTFRASTHKRMAPSRYPATSKVKESFDTVTNGVVEELVHDPGGGTPLGFVRFDSGEVFYTVVPEGVFEGKQIQFGGNALVDVGNILPLCRNPAGTMNCNIALHARGG